MPEPTSTRKLLVVDDESEIVEILKQILQPLNAYIHTASNGKEALAIILRESIDAVISDINMPQMDGIQLLVEIRCAGLATPFVILTAFGDKQNILEALRLDATDFLEKPFKPEEVLRVMQRALEIGIAMNDLDRNFSEQFKDSELSVDELHRLKAMRKAIRALQIDAELLNKKSA